MNAPAKIDVVIPAFNAARFIGETIETVFAQSVAPEKIIVVDDGSTDETFAVASTFRGVDVIRHADKGNHGQAASLNLALSHCTAKYVAFLDADDTWAETKLAQCVAKLETAPNAGMVFSDGYVINESGVRQYQYMRPGHVEEAAPEHLLLDCYIKTPSSVVVRRSVLQSVGPLREKIVACDHDIWLRIKEVAEVLYIPSPLIGYRVHSGQLSLRRGMWESGFTVLDAATRRFSYSASTVRRRRAVLHYRLAVHDLVSRRFAAAMGHSLMAAVLDPSRTVNELASRVRERILPTPLAVGRRHDGQ